MTEALPDAVPRWVRIKAWHYIRFCHTRRWKVLHRLGLLSFHSRLFYQRMWRWIWWNRRPRFEWSDVEENVSIVAGLAEGR